MPMLSPCERTIVTSIPNGYGVLDIGWALSQQNRKAYRQGMEYAISNVEIFGLDPAAEGSVQLFRLPNTWVTANAWVKAFKIWQAQQDDAMDSSGSRSTAARYRDFKLYYNNGHRTGEYAGATVAQMHPSGFLSQATAQVIDSGAMMEWEASTFTVPNLGGGGGTTEEFYGGMLGGDISTYRGLIRAYAESRSRPNPLDPSTVTDPLSPPVVEGGLYAEMQDVGEDLEEILDGVRNQNNAAPYVIGGVDSAHEFYPWGTNQGSDQGVSHDRLIVRAGSTISTDSTGPFTALLGLLWFNNGGSAVECRIHITPGSYHGVMARPMQEVN